WNGWFDHWGEEHHERSAESMAESFREVFEEGGSVNIYMFHGGTNFGLYSGANCIGNTHESEEYMPIVTSYD
ncbi:MAG: beta-galactosidase, partial [Oscillospiraceae bacterium]